MFEPSACESANNDGGSCRRSRPVRVWLLCAVSWLATVSTLSILDHHRAIMRSVESYFAERVPETFDLAMQWLIAAARYSGHAIGLYGVLPVALTFVLFVLFLPWAVRWTSEGSWED